MLEDGKNNLIIQGIKRIGCQVFERLPLCDLYGLFQEVLE